MKRQQSYPTLQRNLETVDQQLLRNALSTHRKVFGRHLGIVLFLVNLTRRVLALPILLLFRWQIGRYAYGYASTLLCYVYIRYLYYADFDSSREDEKDSLFCVLSCHGANAGDLSYLIDVAINHLWHAISCIPAIIIGIGDLPDALNLYYQAGEHLFLYLLSFAVIALSVGNGVYRFMSTAPVRAEYRGQSLIYMALERFQIRHIKRELVLFIIEPLLAVLIGLLLTNIQPKLSFVFISGGIALLLSEATALRYKAKFENGQSDKIY